MYRGGETFGERGSRDRIFFQGGRAGNSYLHVSQKHSMGAQIFQGGSHPTHWIGPCKVCRQFFKELHKLAVKHTL